MQIDKRQPIVHHAVGVGFSIIILRLITVNGCPILIDVELTIFLKTWCLAASTAALATTADR